MGNQQSCKTGSLSNTAYSIDGQHEPSVKKGTNKKKTGKFFISFNTKDSLSQFLSFSQVFLFVITSLRPWERHLTLLS